MLSSILVLISLCLIAARGATAQVEAPPQFALKWGTHGTGAAQFDGPTGIAVDSAGFVYVADYVNCRIQKFTSSDGGFVTAWGTQGGGDGQLFGPAGIALDGNGVLYVCDALNRRIQKFTSDGAFLGYLAGWSSATPVGVAIDRHGDVYVTGYDAKKVFRFSSAGQLLTSWGTQGTGPGQFESPGGIGVDASRYVYVSDNTNNTLQKFTSDGVFVDRWSNAMLLGPKGVAVDENGHIYVAVNHRILKFTSDGVVVSSWGGEGAGSGDGEFLLPNSIATAGRAVYVTDRNDRVQKFEYPVSVQPRPWGQVKSVYR
jgi:hypothetical protein